MNAGEARRIAIRILDEFEDLLDEKNVTIPSSNGEGREEEARVYGRAGPSGAAGAGTAAWGSGSLIGRPFRAWQRRRPGPPAPGAVVHAPAATPQTRSRGRARAGQGPLRPRQVPTQARLPRPPSGPARPQ